METKPDQDLSELESALLGSSYTQSEAAGGTGRVAAQPCMRIATIERNRSLDVEGRNSIATERIRLQLRKIFT